MDLLTRVIEDATKTQTRLELARETAESLYELCFDDKNNEVVPDVVIDKVLFLISELKCM